MFSAALCFIPSPSPHASSCHLSRSIRRSSHTQSNQDAKQSIPSLLNYPHVTISEVIPSGMEISNELRAAASPLLFFITAALPHCLRLLYFSLLLFFCVCARTSFPLCSHKHIRSCQFGSVTVATRCVEGSSVVRQLNSCKSQA